MSAAAQPAFRLALGPVQYYWPAERLRAFYAEAAEWPVDTVYLGEVVCAKRRPFDVDTWLEIGEELTASGKEVVLSTLTLLEAASELGALRRRCAERRFLVEANDMAAVNILGELACPFVGGPTLNVYNARSLAVLAAQGLRRWVPPVELSGQALEDVLRAAPPECECEIFAWGRMPLAWSARCFTARSANRPKDRCGELCLSDPDGRLIHTREDRPFLVLNGIQTQSALTLNLAPVLPELHRLGVGRLRISPQSAALERVVRCFRALADGVAGQATLEELESLAPVGTCDGYWRGEAGFSPPAPRGLP